MANFYNDNPALKHHLTHPLMRKIVELKERNFTDAEKYDYAPFDFADAMDSYEKVLEIAGEISGEIVAQNAEDVDHEGPHVVDGHIAPSPLQWSEFFIGAIYYGCRYGKPCGCRIRKYLGLAGLRRNNLRICK